MINKRHWLPIESAPRDGGPVWVRGYNYGDPDRGQHHCWAFWDGDDWIAASPGRGDTVRLKYLTHWMTGCV